MLQPAAAALRLTALSLPLPQRSGHPARSNHLAVASYLLRRPFALGTNPISSSIVPAPPPRGETVGQFVVDLSSFLSTVRTFLSIDTTAFKLFYRIVRLLLQRRASFYFFP